MNGIIENVPNFIISIPKLWIYRGGEISLSNIIANREEFFKILFIVDDLKYNTTSKFGTLYFLSIPLVILGLVECIQTVRKDLKQKKFSLDFMIFIAFISISLIGLCTYDPNTNKLNAIYIPMVYFAGRFLEYIYNNRKYFAELIIIFYFISNMLFSNYYFSKFANMDLEYAESSILEAAARAEELNKNKIYVEDSVQQPYIYTLISTPISPYEFNENLVIKGIRVLSYGKYEFNIPDYIDKEAVYIIKNDKNKINNLILSGFNIEEYGEFSVLWK